MLQEPHQSAKEMDDVTWREEEKGKYGTNARSRSTIAIRRRNYFGLD
jgi:hypothetical protein